MKNMMCWKQKKIRNILVCALGALFFVPSVVVGQNIVTAPNDGHTSEYRVKIIEVVESQTELLPPENIEYTTQTLRAQILSEEKRGEEVVFDNDFVELKAGDVIFLEHTVLEGFEYYTVKEFDRTWQILLLVGLFVGAVFVFGGRQGARSLFSLVVSLGIIVYVLIPALLAGFSPVLTSVLVATSVLFFAIFMVHGFNMTSVIGFVGTISAVLITGVLAAAFVYLSHLTGFASDEATYLHVYTGGELDIAGLLLAAIIIGSLGVLDDIAITQVSVVKEFFALDKNLSTHDVYKKAYRVGKAHIGALINTLVLAYTGAALPILLLFFYSNDATLLSIINKEVFATEIIRSLVGSIGLIAAVPITTWFAVVYFSKK